jgi:hypothetical protein
MQIGFKTGGQEFSLVDMLVANASDEAFTEWLQTAKPGDRFADGEGCECVHQVQRLDGLTYDGIDDKDVTIRVGVFHSRGPRAAVSFNHAGASNFSAQIITDNAETLERLAVMLQFAAADMRKPAAVGVAETVFAAESTVTL